MCKCQPAGMRRECSRPVGTGLVKSSWCRWKIKFSFLCGWLNLLNRRWRTAENETGRIAFQFVQNVVHVAYRALCVRQCLINRVEIDVRQTGLKSGNRVL